MTVFMFGVQLVLICVFGALCWIALWRLVKALDCKHVWVDGTTHKNYRGGGVYHLETHQRCDKCGKHRMSSVAMSEV